MFLLFLLAVAIPTWADCPTGSYEIPATSQCVFLQPRGEVNGYFQSHAVCNQLGGELLSIHNGFLAGSLYYIAQNAKVSGLALIGADRIRTGNWSWFDQSPFDYQGWAKGQPSSMHRNQDCSSLNLEDLGWYATVCSEAHPYFCEISANECPGEWTAHNQSCYYVFDSVGMSMDDSRRKCIDFGGDLVSIHSAEENAFVTELAGQRGPGIPWIGFQCSSANKTKSWSDGTPVTIDYSSCCDYGTTTYRIYSSAYTGGGQWQCERSTSANSVVCKKPFISTMIKQLQQEDALLEERTANPATLARKQFKKEGAKLSNDKVNK